LHQTKELSGKEEDWADCSITGEHISHVNYLSHSIHHSFVFS
jgi:hypothetical protein